MKIYVPERGKTGIGGGFSFTKNIISVLKDKVDFVDNWEDSDICFIVGATLLPNNIERDIKSAGKKIALRVDGIPEDWRNRGKGWRQLKDYSRDADLVIYQSEFIKRTVGRLLGKEGAVIYNGVDKSVFKPEGEKFDRFGSPSLLHINYRGDPNKRWDEVIVRFREYKVDNPDSTVIFVGNYPRDIMHYNFGMLSWEKGVDYQHISPIEDRALLAKIMRSVDYIAYPSFADPCPNTLLECLSCGLKPIWLCDYGSSPEIMDLWNSGFDFGRERMVGEYMKIFESLL